MIVKTKYMIKGNLLPKSMRVKGKSKFMYPRLVEEKIAFGVDRWDGTLRESPLDKLYKKLGVKSKK